MGGSIQKSCLGLPKLVSIVERQSHLGFMGLYWFSGLMVTKHYKLSGLNSRNVLSSDKARIPGLRCGHIWPLPSTRVERGVVGEGKSLVGFSPWLHIALSLGLCLYPVSPIGLGAHDLIWTWWLLWRPYFQIHSHSEVLLFRTPTHLFWEDVVHPVTVPECLSHLEGTFGLSRLHPSHPVGNRGTLLWRTTHSLLRLMCFSSSVPFPWPPPSKLLS